jgi:hypothetical protein
MSESAARITLFANGLIMKIVDNVLRRTGIAGQLLQFPTHADVPS